MNIFQTSACFYNHNFDWTEKETNLKNPRDTPLKLVHQENNPTHDVLYNSRTSGLTCFFPLMRHKPLQDKMSCILTEHLDSHVAYKISSITINNKFPLWPIFR